MDLTLHKKKIKTEYLEKPQGKTSHIYIHQVYLAVCYIIICTIVNHFLKILKMLSSLNDVLKKNLMKYHYKVFLLRQLSMISPMRCYKIIFCCTNTGLKILFQLC